MRDAAEMLFSPGPTRLGDPQTPSASYHIPYDTPYLQQQFMTGLGVDLRSHFSGEASSSAGVVTPAGRRNPHRLARTMRPPCGTSSRHHGHAQQIPSHDEDNDDDDSDDEDVHMDEAEDDDGSDDDDEDYDSDDDDGDDDDDDDGNDDDGDDDP
ncbi:hypothetical protein Fmac_028771 [Flemingia macrophylla]|uniref:Uncharacterized protein n=1 Tax=Flemingia macrophylla TaxID=520843 RepID=A0ABD1L8G1_9FABA